MATSVEAVQITDLKKGQILTTIQKNKKTILHLNTQIHDHTNLSGMLSQWILHFKLTENTIKHVCLHLLAIFMMYNFLSLL